MIYMDNVRTCTCVHVHLIFNSAMFYACKLYMMYMYIVLFGKHRKRSST